VSSLKGSKPSAQGDALVIDGLLQQEPCKGPTTGF
jgi:hypothetical protein